MTIKIAFVVPCFNESKRLNFEYFEFLLQRDEVCLYFVDDGSVDSTRNLLENFAAPRNNCHVYINGKNRGKSESIRYGMNHALKSNPDAIAYLDADGAFSRHEVLRLLDIWKDLGARQDIGLLSGARVKLAGRNIERRLIRHFFGRIVATMLAMRVDVSIYDIQSGYKIFRVTNPLREALYDPFQTRWFVDFELIKRIQSKSQMNIYEEPLKDWSDVPGSKVNFKAYIQIINDLILIFTRIQG